MISFYGAAVNGMLNLYVLNQKILTNSMNVYARFCTGPGYLLQCISIFNANNNDLTLNCNKLIFAFISNNPMS